jgi:antagonist of KipI
VIDMFKVITPGASSTVQDLGRYGFQQFGVPVSGALDRYAFRVANLLVRNPESTAVLELTFQGPTLEALWKGTVAVTGADMAVLVNGRPQAQWESFAVAPGDSITVKAARRGLRSYLAVRGGILVPEVMGSRSTFVAAAIGGLDGRALARGDVLCRGDADFVADARMLPESFRPRLDSEVMLRALPGPQDDFFDEGMELFFSSEFKVSSHADRRGYRLEGPRIPMKPNMPTSIISEPNIAGMVQVPSDGQPIIMLVETTAGGYAKISTVISPDLDLIAQLRPGDAVRFMRVDLVEAHWAYVAYHENLDLVRGTILGRNRQK